MTVRKILVMILENKVFQKLKWTENNYNKKCVPKLCSNDFWSRKFTLTQSHYTQVTQYAVSNFYGTGIEIWAGFGPVGNTEKKVGGQLWATFEGGFFMFSGSKKIDKHYSVRTKKLHN